MANGTTITSDAYIRLQLTWIDYTLFATILSLSILIGIYFGCFTKKKDTAKEYLFGNKEIKILPVGISLIGSKITSAMVTTPAEIYYYGAYMWIYLLSFTIATSFTAFITYPVFYKLQLTSIFEYLELRFDAKVRRFASIIFTLSVVIYLPIIAYIPVLAFSQASGIATQYITIVVVGGCVFYTTIGGFKAVVWTDVLQISVTIFAVVIMFILGINKVGGLSNIFKTAAHGDRLTIDFDWDPTKRDTFWAFVIGATINYLPSIAYNQDSMQKLLAIPSLNGGRVAILILVIGLIVVNTISYTTGYIIYYLYGDCDLLTTGRIQRPDMLLPYYVMDVTNGIPGFAGMFIAGIFCAAVSTLSSFMNALSALIYEDIIPSKLKQNIHQQNVTNVLKGIVITIGVICMICVFIVEHLGQLWPLLVGVFSIASAVSLGLFTLGLFFPNVNTKGALYGSIVSLIFVTWLVVGSYWYKLNGYIKYPTKPLSTEGCDFDFIPKVNQTVMHPDRHFPKEDIFYLYRISHFYISTIGLVVNIISGVIISWCTKTEKPLDKSLIVPMMHFMIKKHDTVASDELQFLNPYAPGRKVTIKSP